MDYAEKMVEKAKELTIHFENIRVEYGDILSMEKVKGREYNKFIVGSVLQYLENYHRIETSLNNIFNVMSPKGIDIFTHNPDIREKDVHLSSYNRLNWTKEKISKAIEMEGERL